MKWYQYAVRCVGDDAPQFQTEVYQEARDFADGWNEKCFTNKRAEVLVRTVEVTPWVLHHHEKVLAKRRKDAAS